MKVLVILIVATIILTIGTKMVFFIQRVYCDIKGIALSAVLSIVAGMVTMAYPLVAIVVAYGMFLYLICKVGEVDLIPDAMLATLIGTGILGSIILNNLEEFNIFY